MAIDFVPRRFHPSLWRQKSVDCSFSDCGSSFDCSSSESEEAVETSGYVGKASINRRPAVASLRAHGKTTLDENNNIQSFTVHRSLRRNGRLTSDDFISKEDRLTEDLNLCEHLSDMCLAEIDLVVFGFGNVRDTRGLVPHRFLPSLIAFREKVPSSKQMVDIPQKHFDSPVSANNLILSASEPREELAVDGMSRTIAGTPKDGMKTIVPASQSDDTDVRTCVAMCSVCGRYTWSRSSERGERFSG